MLHEFLRSHRSELVTRCRSKVAERTSLQTTENEDKLGYGVPLFLDQLIKTLEIEQGAHPLQSREVSGSAGGGDTSEMEQAATQHGRELLRQGFDVEEVVHGYGDLCQAITDLAVELNVPFSVDEFRTLNRCVDNAAASSVREFTSRRDFATASQQTLESNQRLGYFAHELRNHLATAMLARSVIKAGNVGTTGSTGAVLDRSLLALGNLIDRSLAEVRLEAEMPLQQKLFSLAGFIMEVKVSAVLDAQFRNCTLKVSAVDRRLAIKGDRDLLFSALNNLLQNAFKFTRHGSEVTLNATASADRILLDVQDHGGGLPPGFVDTMFQPFTQGSENRSGLGLGLSIAKRSVEANDGVLRVRDLPGSGCIFTIDLPLYKLPQGESHE